MKREDIRISLEKIQAPNNAKERIYKNILEKAEDKKYVSKRKLHFVKMRMDRIVPYAAAFVILFCCFAVYGVNTGLFTGGVIPESINETGISTSQETTPESTASTANDEAGAPDQNLTDDSATSKNEAAPNPLANQANDKKIAGNAISNSSATPVTVTAVLPFDVGYTAYTIENIPQDAFVLWDELMRIDAVPQLVLDGFSLENNLLVLNFSDSLQKRLNAGATSYIVTGIVKSFSSLYPEITEIKINSNNTPIEFENKVIDCTSLINEDVSITNRVNLTYGDDQ